MRKIIQIYTDGSAGPTNPGPGGFGVVVVFDDEHIETYAERENETTNNRMEMKAILYAYRKYGTSISNDSFLHSNIPIVYSDSSYCVNTFTNWIFGWKDKGWRKANNQTPENMDLLQEFMELYDSGLRIDLRKIKGHAGHKYNEMADKLASGKIKYVCQLEDNDEVELDTELLKKYEIKLKGGKLI